MFQTLPEFLDKSRYQNPVDGKNTAWQLGFDTKDTPFEWMGSHPAAADAMSEYMVTRRVDQASWVSILPIREIVDSKTLSSDRALFIDIGGNAGHKAIEFRK